MYSLKDMIKKLFNHFFALFLVLNLNSVWAESSCKFDQCGINVEFRGEYLEETCEIDIDGSGNKGTITLPTISVKSLDADSSEAGATPFSVSLNNCPYNRKVALYFRKGSAGMDARTGNLLNSQGDNYSWNVQVRLRKEDGSLIFIDDLNTMQRYNIPASGDVVKHTFMASYYANGNKKVTAGEIQTQSEIDLVYE